MGYKEVSSLDADVTIALGKKDKSGKPYPKQAEGYYLGSRTVKNKRGESELHFFQTAKGNLGVWGTTDLNRKLGGVNPGTMVRITSTGMKPTPNGDMYTYRVELDEDNQITVAASDVAQSYDDGEVGYRDENNEESYETQYDSDDDELAAQSLAAAERQAKVQALLSKGKNLVSKKN